MSDFKVIKLSDKASDARYATVQEGLDEVKGLCEFEGYDNVFVVAFKFTEEGYDWCRRSAGKDIKMTTLIGILAIAQAAMIEESKSDD